MPYFLYLKRRHWSLTWVVYCSTRVIHYSLWILGKRIWKESTCIIDHSCMNLHPQSFYRDPAILITTFYDPGQNFQATCMYCWQCILQNNYNSSCLVMFKVYRAYLSTSTSSRSWKGPSGVARSKTKQCFHTRALCNHIRWLIGSVIDVSAKAF